MIARKCIPHISTIPFETQQASTIPFLTTVMQPVEGFQHPSIKIAVAHRLFFGAMTICQWMGSSDRSTRKHFCYCKQKC